MFEEGQLYSQVTTDDARRGDRSSRARPSGRQRSGLPPPAKRDRRRPRWRGGPGEPGAGDRLRRGRAGGVAHRLPRARAPSTSATPCAEYRDAVERVALPTDHVPGLDEVTERHPAAERMALRARGRASSRSRSSTARSPTRLSLHPVPAPPRRPALHARARHHARGRSATAICWRPRPSASCTASPVSPPAACAIPRACASSRGCSGSRSSSARWSRRTSCAPTARGSSRATARSRSFARWRTGRSTWWRWARSTTTSPPISRSCTAAESVEQIVEVVGGFFADCQRRVDRRAARTRRGAA